jgi:hypothetical protein
MTAPNAGECVEQAELNYITGEDMKWHSTLERVQVISYETDHAPAM